MLRHLLSSKTTLRPPNRFLTRCELAPCSAPGCDEMRREVQCQSDMGQSCRRSKRGLGRKKMSQHDGHRRNLSMSVKLSASFLYVLKRHSLSTRLVIAVVLHSCIQHPLPRVSRVIYASSAYITRLPFPNNLSPLKVLVLALW